jgi:precorrin-2 dehydrogenase/sirohydrochlorin ferrochelatase
MIPLFVDCSGRRVIIFGGGEVAARKCAYFTAADVTVLSRSFSPAVLALPVRREELDLGSASDGSLRKILAGAFLVIAAISDPEQNNRIGRLCAEAHILFNNADGNAGSVMLPAVARGKNYTIAISTGGASPAISRFIREKIERDYPALDSMIELQQRLREELKETVPDQEKRSAILTEILDSPSVWEALGENPAATWKEIVARYVHG